MLCGLTAALWMALGATGARAQIQNVDPYVVTTFSALRVNRSPDTSSSLRTSTSVTFDTAATIRNVSSDTTLTAPMTLVITGISAPGVTLVNKTGDTADGLPFVDVALPSGTLAPGATTDAVVLKFSSPRRAAFTFTASVRARLDTGSVGAWTKFRGNAQNTGRGGGSGATGQERWRFRAGSFVDSCPALGSDGTVYVGSADFYLYALNADGTLKWRFRTGGGVVSSPALGLDGTVYVGSNDRYLYALNANGTLKWRFQTGSAVFSSPALGSDGTVYVGSQDGFVYALNANGTLKWRFLAGDFVYSSPAIGSDGTVYVGSGNVGLFDGFLYAIR